jgi:penicillin-binding protein 1A
LFARAVRFAFAVGALALLALASTACAQGLPSLPPIKRDAQITYLDRSGAVIGVRGGRFPPPVDVTKLPAYVPAAFVAIEDRRFYEHRGFDPIGIARALVTDLGEGRAAQGASTLTQQLARNLFLDNGRTLERKGLELVYAVELEQAYSKQQILGLYLSRVYFGSGAYGIEAASRRYFNKSASALTLREASMLAGVMKSPTNYNPAMQTEASLARSELVLDAMVETGAITSAQRAKASAQTPRVYKTSPTAPAQYFVDWLDAQVRGVLGGRVTDDVVVDTTLDASLEAVAAARIGSVLDDYARAGVQQAAVVSMDGAGRVRAMVGGADFATSPFNRAVDAHRQAGSAWKPFVYLTALETGLTPDSPTVDEPVTINGWTPTNFEPGYLGPITLQTALIHSVNTVAARLANQVGTRSVAALAHRVGITSTINTDPAMALGTTLVTPLEMAQAYTTFANGGGRVGAYGAERIRTAGGRILYRRQAPAPTPAAGNPALGDLVKMLRGVIAQGTGRKAAIAGYDLAGKTGTTSDYKDAWFCGFTGNFTTVVWVGRDDGSAMRGVTGGSAPAEIWRGVMAWQLKRSKAQAIPYGPAPYRPTPSESPPPPEEPQAAQPPAPSPLPAPQQPAPRPTATPSLPQEPLPY